MQQSPTQPHIAPTQHIVPMQQSPTQHIAPMQQSPSQHVVPMQQSPSQHIAPLQQPYPSPHHPPANMLALPIPAAGTAEAWVQQGAALEEHRLKRSRQHPALCMQHCPPDHTVLAGAHALHPQDMVHVNLPDVMTASQYEDLLAVEEEQLLHDLHAQQAPHQHSALGATLEEQMAMFLDEATPCEEALYTPPRPSAAQQPAVGMPAELPEVVTPAKQAFQFETPTKQSYCFETPDKQVCPYPPAHAYFPSRAQAMVQAWVLGKYGSWDALAQHWGVTIVPGC